MTQSADLAGILDEGVDGLMFVVDRLPLLRAFGGVESISAKNLEARYHEQRDLNLRVLAEDAAVLARLGRALADRLDDQFTRVAQLDAVWQGTAGSGAHSGLRNAVSYGDDVRSVVDALAGACDAAVADILHSVGEKSSLAASFAGSTIDGRTPGEVATIVAGTVGGPTGPTPEQGVSWFRAAAGAETGPLDLPAECGRWMREKFVPAIENAVDALRWACDDAARTTSDALAAVASAFDRLDTIGDGLGTGATRVSPAAPPIARPRDPVDAAADLIEAGSGLVTATSGLVEAASDLLEATLDLATAGADLVTAGIEGATAAAGEAVPAPEPATPPPPRPPGEAAGAGDRSVTSGPTGGSSERPDAVPTAVADETEQVARTGTVAAGEAQNTPSSTAVPSNTAVPSTTAGVEVGVVLAEAGPL